MGLTGRNVFMCFSQRALCARRVAQSAEKDSEEVRQRYKICAVCLLDFACQNTREIRTFTFVKRPLFLSLYIYVYIIVLTRIFTPARPLRRLFPGEHLFLLSRRRRLVPLRGEVVAKTRSLCLPLNRRTRLFDRLDRTRAIETTG